MEVSDAFSHDFVLVIETCSVLLTASLPPSVTLDINVFCTLTSCTGLICVCCTLFLSIHILFLIVSHYLLRNTLHHFESVL